MQKSLLSLLFLTHTVFAKSDDNITVLASAQQNMQSFASLIWEKFNSTLFMINEVPVSFFKLLVALFIFALGIFAAGHYKIQISKLTQRSASMTVSTRTLIANIGYYLIVIFSTFLTLNFIGINLSSIALIAGALSVGIGFGLQNIVSNFISGIILMFERSIKIGDYVELSSDLKGRVSDIRMRSTTVTTNNNIDIIVPNQSFIENNVINWTMNDELRRFDIPFSVAYGSDPQFVIDVITEAVKNSGFEDIYTSEKRHTRVVMIGMGASSLDFELLIWLVGGESLFPKRSISRFMILIYNTLNAHNISIPFPQMDVHITKQ